MWDVYETTPLMATNLVSIIVADDYTSAMADSALSNKVKIQVWAPKMLTEQKATEFAVNTTARMLNYFQEYFDIPYPLDKLDSVLVWETEGPAIEHWGTITYGLG
jgi:aminopeptidase 2